MARPLSLFGGQVIPWSGPTTALAAPPSPAPKGDFFRRQGESDSRYRYRGRPRAASGVAPGLTPSGLKAILDDAEAGQPERLFSLLQEISDRDSHVTGVLNTRKLAVAQLSWRVEPASDRRRDRKAAEWVERKLRRIRNWQTGLTWLLGAIEAGVAPVELDWVIDNEEVVIDRLLYAPPRWFLPDPENPERWRLRDMGDLANGVPLIPERWVVHTAACKPGFPLQAGLGRTLAWAWLLKGYSVKDWASYAEIFGTPFRLGTYPDTATADDIDALSAALADMGVNTWAAVPAGMGVQFPSAPSSTGGSVHEPLIKWWNAEISKLVLGQTLTTQESDRGTQALGSVHNEVRQDLVRADAASLADTLTEQIIGPLIRFNLPDAGKLTGLPLLRFDTEPPTDALAEAQAQEARGRVFQLARALGLTISEGQVREELGVAEVGEDDRALGEEEEE